jgi:hypothetical protein
LFDRRKSAKTKFSSWSVIHFYSAQRRSYPIPAAPLARQRPNARFQEMSSVGNQTRSAGSPFPSTRMQPPMKDVAAWRAHVKRVGKKNKSDYKAYCLHCAAHNVETTIVHNKKATQRHLAKCEFYRMQESSPTDMSDGIQPGDSVSQVLPISAQPNQLSITSFATRKPNQRWRDAFERDLLLFTCANDLPFSWIDKYHSRQFLAKYISEARFFPFAIPDRRRLGGQALFDAQQASREKMAISIGNSRCLTLTFDAWRNVRSQNILGVVLVDEKGRAYAHFLHDLVALC